jgi:hypothetical protein
MGDRWIIAVIGAVIYFISMGCGWGIVKMHKMATPRELKLATWLYPVLFGFWVLVTMLVSAYKG